MYRRTKIIIIIIVILVVLALVLLVLAPLMFPKKEKGNINTVNGEPLNVNTGTNGFLPNANVTVNPTPKILTKEPKAQSVLEALARTFAEKFGSFSTHGNYENLKDLKHLMTEDMKQWADNYIQENSKKSNTEFYGVTARAIKVELIAMNDEETSAQAVVTVQKEETGGSLSARKNISYVKLVLDFIKIDGEWKVNAASWK